MAAAPCPAFVQQGGSLQQFGVETLLAQTLIDSIRSIGSAATLQVPGHEARSMACSVFADSKAVYSFLYVLQAATPITACKPLAFDDGVRIVISALPEDLVQKNRNVSPPIGVIKVRSRKGLGSGQYGHPPAPRVLSIIQHHAHGNPQPLGDLHFVVARFDSGSGKPTGVDRPHDCDDDVRAKVDQGASEVRVMQGFWNCQVHTPEKLLTTKSLASSKALTPIQ